MSAAGGRAGRGGGQSPAVHSKSSREHAAAAFDAPLAPSPSFQRSSYHPLQYFKPKTGKLSRAPSATATT